VPANSLAVAIDPGEGIYSGMLITKSGLIGERVSLPMPPNDVDEIE
jgi:hypothetical protein